MTDFKPARVLAIDAFRGITILVMIFVNTLAGVRGMPAWLEHAPADADAMTMVDVVFPAFLFIVGMSVPFAMAQRQAAGDNGWQLARRVLARAAGLLVLGVFMVNAESGFNEAAMGMSIHLWSLLFYACAILVWAVYRFENKTLATVLRAVGLAGLVALALTYRAGPDGGQHMTPQWWGILGLIGWAYLYAAAAWALTRGRMLPLAALALACIVWYCVAGGDAPQSANAVHASIALCGILTARIFFGGEARQQGAAGPFVRALLLAAALAALAWLLQPHFKISKIYATPSWALYSSGICVLLFAAMYWLVDLKRQRAWTAFFRPAAANPLLVYIIPFIVYALMECLHLAFPPAFGAGLPGFLWAVAYAVIVMVMAMGLNRMHIKLQL